MRQTQCCSGASRTPVDESQVLFGCQTLPTTTTNFFGDRRILVHSFQDSVELRFFKKLRSGGHSFPTGHQIWAYPGRSLGRVIPSYEERPTIDNRQQSSDIDSSFVKILIPTQGNRSLQHLPKQVKIIMAEKKVTETTSTQVSNVQPYVLHSPLVIAIEKFAWWRRRRVGMQRGLTPGQIIHNSDGSSTKILSVKAL